MRFLSLQQVGGPMWAVYDSVRDEIVRSYNDKYAREVSTELADLLNRGYEAKIAASAVTEAVQEMPKPVHVRKIGQ